jgi:hypothetical protein
MRFQRAARTVCFRLQTWEAAKIRAPKREFCEELVLRSFKGCAQK